LVIEEIEYSQIQFNSIPSVVNQLPFKSKEPVVEAWVIRGETIFPTMRGDV
jgi:hypothetical protein